MELQQEQNPELQKQEQKKIIANKTFEGLPNIIEDKDGKIYQIEHLDESGKLRKTKEIILKKHLGSEYYRINGRRYSKYLLKTLAIRSRRIIKY